MGRRKAGEPPVPEKEKEGLKDLPFEERIARLKARSRVELGARHDLFDELVDLVADLGANVEQLEKK